LDVLAALFQKYPFLYVKAFYLSSYAGGSIARGRHSHSGDVEDKKPSNPPAPPPPQAIGGLGLVGNPSSKKTDSVHTGILLEI